MSWTRVLFWLLPRRIRSSWALMAITSFGILAAITLMAVGVIYSRALAEGGLRHTLAATSPTILNAWVIVQNRPLGPADYQKLRSTVEEVAGARVGYMLHDTQRLGKSQPNLPLVFTLDERAPALEDLVGRPFFLTDFQKHSELLEGRWPQAALPPLDSPLTKGGVQGGDSPLGKGGVQGGDSALAKGGMEGSGRNLELEAVLGSRTARVLGLKVGSKMYLLPFRNDSSERITFTIVGLAEPIAPYEDYWMHGSFPYFTIQDYGGRSLAPIYITEEAFFGSLGTRYPSLVGDYEWSFFLDTSVLTAATAKPAREAIIGLETDINKRFPRSLVLSGLKNTISDYQRDLTLARVPLFLFISLVVLVILYFLALAMGLLARTRTDEASLLRSRGATTFQVGGLLALGEGVVVLLAMILGPLLALGIVRYLLLATIHPAGMTNRPLSVGLSADMFVVGIMGGLLSLGVLLATSMGLARLGTVEFLRVRARPPTVPLLHRYYIDLLLLAMVALVWWQIQSRGGFVEEALSTNQLEVDLSLLFGPALALLAATLLVLRLLPLLVRLLAWAGQRLGPAWVAFALVRLARDPLPHGALAIILMLAAALGVFGAGFQSTLSRSQREQALYNLGGDLVVEGISFSTTLSQDISAIPGVQNVSPVLRESVTVLEGTSTSSATLLAVEPDTLPYTLWFRDDFAGKSLPELLRPLRVGSHGRALLPQDSAQSITLPVDAQRIGIWVNLDKLDWGLLRQSLSLSVRLSDTGGQYYSVFLGELKPPQSIPLRPPSPRGDRGFSSGGWTYLEAPLPKTPPESLLSLVAIFVSGGAWQRIPSGSIAFDDITVVVPSAPGQAPPANLVIEGFEEPGRWVPLAHAGTAPDTVAHTPQAAHSGQTGLAFSWLEGTPGETPRGILKPSGPFPLAAIGGPTFRIGQELRIRAGQQWVPVVVRDVTDYFPTIDLSLRPFLLVSLWDYTEYLQRIPAGVAKPPEGIWMDLQDTADRSQVISSLEARLPRFVRVTDRAVAVDLAQRDPLAGGGWIGLTLLSVSTLTIVVVLTLVTHAVISVHMGRLDLTVARALGLSRQQLFLSLALERIVIAVIGMAAGGVLGVWLGHWVLGFLDITASGQPVIPPMIISIQKELVALVFVGLVVASLLALLFATLSAHRLRVPDVLRTGE